MSYYHICITFRIFMTYITFCITFRTGWLEAGLARASTRESGVITQSKLHHSNYQPPTNPFRKYQIKYRIYLMWSLYKITINPEPLFSISIKNKNDKNNKQGGGGFKIQSNGHWYISFLISLWHIKYLTL